MKRQSNFWVSERKLEVMIERIVAHELGHAVYALSRGARCVKIRISVRFGRGMRFAGSVNLPPELNKMKHAEMSFAGIIAGCIWEHEMDPFSYFEKDRRERTISPSDLRLINRIESSLWHLAFLRALECIESHWGLIATMVAILTEKFFEQNNQTLVVHYDQKLLKRSEPKQVPDSKCRTR